MVVGRLLSYWVSVAFQGRLLLNFEGTGPGGDYYWEAGHTQLIGEMGTLPTIPRAPKCFLRRCLFRKPSVKLTQVQVLRGKKTFYKEIVQSMF